MTERNTSAVQERMKTLPRLAALPPEAAGTPAEAALHRNQLAERLHESFDGNPRVAFTYTMGSTADGTENQFSDKDEGVVLRSDEDLNHMLRHAGRAFGSFGELTGYYRYNPYHFYVTYQGPMGPMPLDIYFLTEEMHNLMRSKDAVTVVDHIGGAAAAEDRVGVVSRMMKDAFGMAEKASREQESGDAMAVVSTLEAIRSNSLIHLLRVIEGYQIPHVKAVKLEKFDPEIRDLFVRTFAQPVAGMTGDAINATRGLLYRMLEDASRMPDLQGIGEAMVGSGTEPAAQTGTAVPERVTEQAVPGLSGGVIGYFDGIPEVGLANLKKDPTGRQNLVVMMRDDESLNEQVEYAAEALSLCYPGATLKRLTPVHFKMEQDGESVDVFLTSSSLYFTSRRNDTLTLVDNRALPPSPRETVFETAPDVPELEGDRELIVKGVVRTFRLLSKINKKDNVTFTYIMNSIRSGQLAPLMKRAGMDPAGDAVFPLTYARPTDEGVRLAVQAAMTLFAEAYLHIADRAGLRDLDVYMEKAYQAVSEFTHI